MKLKSITPKISDRLLSYVMNSLLPISRLCVLGIATALLMIAIGIALDKQV